MKVAIITDQHFGMRKGSQIFHNFIGKFYKDVFFPTLEEEGIYNVIDLGDTFDNRKSIDFWSLEWAKKNYYDILRQHNAKVHTVIGNHTAYYKNTNKINTVELLLEDYHNVECYSQATEVMIGGFAKRLAGAGFAILAIHREQWKKVSWQSVPGGYKACIKRQ